MCTKIPAVESIKTSNISGSAVCGSYGWENNTYEDVGRLENDTFGFNCPIRTKLCPGDQNIQN